MSDDDQNSFAMRHRARRAAQLASVIRRSMASYGMSDDILASAVEAMPSFGWEAAARNVAIETGVPFRPPSETTKQICIGLLSMPSLEGLVTHGD